MRIYLTGFMGAGKSTIGRILSQELRVPFYDLDSEIEQKTGKKIPEIFAESGEPEFRKLEMECLQHTGAPHGVIATGGGCFPSNQEWMLQNGLVIYLEVPFHTLVKRIGADPSRPLWRNAERLYNKRKPDYEKAHHKVDAAGPVPEIVSRITEIVKSQKTPES